MRSLLFVFAAILFVQANAFALSEPPFKNWRLMARELGMASYLKAGLERRSVKVAILDNGFKGHAAEIGRTLPVSTVFHAGPVAPPTDSEESHGLVMAQLLTAILTDGGRSTEIPFELHLFTAYGFSGLNSAIDQVIQNKFDIVLYAQVWEYGGNGDGKGFINTAVNRAVDAGILWVNAAGNFAQDTYSAKIERTTDDWAKLPGANQSVRVRCKAESGKKCRLRTVLSWNDFKDDVNVGTDKDLDLVLTDDALTVLQVSALKQKSDFPEGSVGFSKYSREIIEAEVGPGLYYLRAKIRSSEFSDEDRLRITVSGDRIETLDRTSKETILPPADNAGVLTVGASDADKSSRSRELKKPELYFPSLLELDSGETVKGSSQASAAVAAGLVAWMAVDSSLTRDKVIARAGRGGTGRGGGGSDELGRGLPLAHLGFAPTAPGCFRLANMSYVPPYLFGIIQAGAILVETTMGPKFFTVGDPAVLVPGGVPRVRFDDIVAMSPQGWQLWPRSVQANLAPGTYEVVQIPLDQRICGSGTGGGSGAGGSSFRLPRR